MATESRILGFKPLELALIVGGGYLILKKPIDTALGGISDAIGGAGSGVSTAFQGAGQGVGDALQGVGGGIGQTFSEFGQTVGAGGDYIQAAALQAQLDAIQAGEVRRASQARTDYLNLQEQAQLENERIKALGSFQREQGIQNTSNEIVASFENTGKLLRNATGIPADFSQGTRNLLGDLGNRLQRGTDIALRSANQALTPAWDFYSNPLKSAQAAAALIIPMTAAPKPLAKASGPVASATYIKGNDPKVVGAAIAAANASQAAQEIAKSQASKGNTSATPKVSPSPAPSPSSKSTTMKAPAGYKTETFKVGSQTFTRTRKIR